MPYKDPLRKRAWESKHRQERLTRRRELRRIAAAREASNAAPQDPSNATPQAQGTSASFLVLPFVAGGALAAYSPKLAMGAGGLTVLVAAIYRKHWLWWVAGAFTLALALFFQFKERHEDQ